MPPFFDFPVLKNLIEKIGGDNNKFIDYHPDNRKLTINLNLSGDLDEQKLNAVGELKKQLMPMLSPGNQFELQAVTSEKKLEDVEKFERSRTSSELYSFVMEKIPQKDKYIWLSALMLKQASDDGSSDKVWSIKSQMISEHQQKGRNIANICTAGYLEDYIMPWYEHYVEELNDRKSFLENYESIVDNLLFIIFVSSDASTESIRVEIENKIQNLVGAHIEYLFIHAIGKPNIKKAELALEGLEELVSEIKNIDKTTSRLTLKAKITL